MKSAYSVSEVNRIKAVEYKRGVKSALEGVLNAVSLEMFDKQGFTREQVDAIMNGAMKTFQSIDEGYLDLNDVKQTLKEEYDLVIECQ